MTIEQAQLAVALRKTNETITELLTGYFAATRDENHGMAFSMALMMSHLLQDAASIHRAIMELDSAEDAPEQE